MLERARLEAAEREAEQKRRAAEAERKADEEKRAELQRFIEEAEAKHREEERQAKESSERKAKEAAERSEKEQTERQAKELAEREAKALAEQQAKDAADRQAREVTEREAKEAAERQARELAERQAKALAEHQAKEAADREAKETADRQAKELAEREAKEAAEREQRAAREADETRRRLEAAREEEGRRLTEKLKKLEDRQLEDRQQASGEKPRSDGAKSSEGAKSEEDMAKGDIDKDGKSSEEMGLGAGPAAMPGPDTAVEPSGNPRTPSPGTRVTVLLILEPGTNGIRRYGKKTADPVLCVGGTCWISAGPGKGAVGMTRGKALGPGNTLGRRAAACNQSLACIYRDLDLKAERAPLQPVDLRIMRHDRREELSVHADSSCDFDGRRLHCAAPYSAKNWRAWVVPEHLAASIGADALQAALASGLPASRAASLER